MSRHTLSLLQREDRIERRLTLRETASAKVDQLREWRQARASLAQKRARERAAELRDDQSRGVHRVPAGLTDGNPLQRRPITRPAPVADETKQDGTKRTPRYPSQPSYRRPRRRDMPGAIERRLVRAQKEWAALAAREDADA